MPVDNTAWKTTRVSGPTPLAASTLATASCSGRAAALRRTDQTPHRVRLSGRCTRLDASSGATRPRYVRTFGRQQSPTPRVHSLPLVKVPRPRDCSLGSTQVAAAPLPLVSMIAGFGIALLVFGLPAAWWMRKSCKETNKTLRSNAAADIESGDQPGDQPQPRRVPTIKNVARAIIHAQRAMDDLQRGMLRSMVAEMERQSAQQLAQAQSVQIKGTRGERREALRQKHRHQRAALANQLDAVDVGLNKILQDQGVGGSAAAVVEEKRDVQELGRAESRKVLAQYDQHVEEMSKQLKTRAQSQSENLEKKLEEKRNVMKQRLLEMEKLMERQGLSGQIVKAPKQPSGAPSAAAESAKKRQTRAVAVKKLDLTGDGNTESTGYDTTGDGIVDAVDLDGGFAAPWLAESLQLARPHCMHVGSYARSVVCFWLAGDGQIDAYLQVKEEETGKPEFVAPNSVVPGSPRPPGQP